MHVSKITTPTKKKKLHWWEKQSTVTHLSDCSKLSSMAVSKIRNKETKMECIKASAFMFRSPQETWSEMPSGISTFPKQRESGLAKTGSDSSEANSAQRASAFD